MKSQPYFISRLISIKCDLNGGKLPRRFKKHFKQLT